MNKTINFIRAVGNTRAQLIKLEIVYTSKLMYKKLFQLKIYKIFIKCKNGFTFLTIAGKEITPQFIFYYTKERTAYLQGRKLEVH